MLDKNLLQVIEPAMKPTAFEAMLEVEKLFKTVDYTEYEFKLDQYTEDPDLNISNLVIEVESVFINSTKHVLNLMGVTLQDGDYSLRLLADLVVAMEDMVSPDNLDLLMAMDDGFEDGQSFLVNILSELTGEPVGYWLAVIEDFDMSAILSIKRMLDIELTGEEQQDVNEYMKRTKSAVVKLGKEDCIAAFNYITSRGTGEEFGYSFILAVQVLWNTLEHLIQPGQTDRLTKTLLLLALGSNLDGFKIKDEIENVLDRMEVPFSDRVRILSDVEKYVNENLSETSNEET